MKPILVLGPQRAGTPPLEQLQVEVHRTALTGDAVANAASYSAVLVVDDASAATVQRLLLALRMCRRPHVRIGVLSYLDEAQLRQALFGRGPPPMPGELRPDPPRPDLPSRERHLKIGLDKGVLSVEYQAV